MPQKYTKPDRTQPAGQEAGLGYVPTRSKNQDGSGGGGGGSGGIIVSGPPGNRQFSIDPAILGMMGAGIGLGQDGEDGAGGPPGQQGPAGNTGATGPQGPIGFGFDGRDGEDGFAIPGVQGPQGNTGTTGPQGPIGFAIDGQDGEEGMAVPGPQGPGLILPLAVGNGGTGTTLGIGWILISEQTPSGVGQVTFSSIPATFRDLRIVVRGAGTKAATFVTLTLRLNNDSGANYNNENIQYNNSTPGSGGVVAQTSMFIGYLPAASGVTNGGGSSEVTIYDYRGTTFIKAMTFQSGVRVSTAASGMFASTGWGDYMSTSAITQADVFVDTNNFAAGSVVSLYASY